MSFESFVAWRYLRAKRKVGLITIISAISIGGITIGVAALICVLSVFNGFNNVVKGLLVGFDPHLRITGVSGPIEHPDSLLSLVRSTP
jgi:lipoprotein-releasing system permease protein